MTEVLIQRLDPELAVPAYAHPGDAGADLVTTSDVTLKPGERALVGTGIAIVLGCPEINMTADACFGLQPELSLRIAVIDVGGKTLLAWARTEEGAVDVPAFFAEFETMLKGLKFT